jgi:tRNA(Arg) A34 adenosine deaminase TadA
MKAKKEFMLEAIKTARKSAEKGDYANGAVVVKNNKIISRGETRLFRAKDPTVHAEIVAIRGACRKLKSRFLDGCVLYSTHEPCPMCASAAIWAKMEGIVFGARISDAKQKQTKRFSWRQIDVPCRYIIKKGTPKLGLVEGFLRKECIKLFSLSK